jgi:hypothetical protein
MAYFLSGSIALGPQSAALIPLREELERPKRMRTTGTWQRNTIGAKREPPVFVKLVRLRWC